MGYNRRVIYSLSGKIEAKHGNFVVLGIHGVGLKVFASSRTINELAGEVDIFTHLHVKEDALDLYGFRSKAELDLFEKLISISGVGPKSALSIMDVSDLKNIVAAIQEGRPDLLTQASGIGRKTAERIIIELRGKVGMVSSEGVVREMESDADVLEALSALGYKRDGAKSALEKVAPDVKGVELRLRAALKILGKNKTA